MSHDDDPTTADAEPSRDDPRQRALDALRRENEAEARLWQQRAPLRRPGDIEDERVPDEPVVDSKTDLPDTDDLEAELGGGGEA